MIKKIIATQNVACIINRPYLESAIFETCMISTFILLSFETFFLKNWKNIGSSLQNREISHVCLKVNDKSKQS